MDYRTTLADSREGVNLTVQEARAIADVIAPLLKQGQSPYQILAAHPELSISEKTLYNYIGNDVFHEVAGITVMDLRRYPARFPKGNLKVIRNVLTVSTFRDALIRITGNTFQKIRMFLSPRWIPSTTTGQTDHLCKRLSLFRQASFSLLSMILKHLNQ